MKVLKLLLAFSLIPALTGVALAQVKYVSGNNSWNPDSLGNHRAVVTVPFKEPAVKVIIEWRRRDDPADKGIIVVDAKANKRVLNVKAENISRESGTVYFEPTSGPGKYYVYYMPYKVKDRSNYPNAVYTKMQNTAADEWLAKTAKVHTLMPDYLESVNSMNSFYPMEVIATANETQKLIAANPGKDYLAFTEDRLHPIKMQHDLPQRWIGKGITNKFTDAALKGENFSYQLGLYPVTKGLQNVHLTFSALNDGKSHAIPPSLMSCLNTDGTKYDGSALINTVNVSKGDVQALWCLVNVLPQTAAGIYNGTVTVSADGVASTQVKISLTVKPQLAVKGGVNDPQKQTRLAWLNSTLAQKNDVIKPYTPLQVDDKNISLLGRKVILANSGFPDKIQTFFNPEMTGMADTPKNILGENIHFHIVNSATHKDIAFKNAGVTFIER
jgi:hypothetical protein